MEKISIHFYLAWMVALVATLGSLFFGEVMGFVPCSMCWYQRIFMYPIAVLLTVGVFRSDSKALLSVLPLAILGGCIAIYHNLLMWGVISEAAAPCRSGVPCSTRYIEYFGFITIPFLSLVSFGLILIFIILQRKNYEQ